MDRVCQQALVQVLAPIFEPTFREASFGYRPGSTHKAMRRIWRQLGQAEWIADGDLSEPVGHGHPLDANGLLDHDRPSCDHLAPSQPHLGAGLAVDERDVAHGEPCGGGDAFSIDLALATVCSLAYSSTVCLLTSLSVL